MGSTSPTRPYASSVTVPAGVYALCYYDSEQKYYYMKRFELELGDKMQYFLDEQTMRAVAFTGKAHAKLAIAYGGANSSRPMDIVDVDDFIGVKSHRAKGKRITTFEVETLTFIEPEEPAEEPMPEAEDDAGMTQDAVYAADAVEDSIRAICSRRISTTCPTSTIRPRPARTTISRPSSSTCFDG